MNSTLNPYDTALLSQRSDMGLAHKRAVSIAETAPAAAREAAWAAAFDAEIALYKLDRLCKQKKLLPWTPEDLVSETLCMQHPKAMSRKIAEFRGSLYRLRFLPLDGHGGQVSNWARRWELLPEGSAAALLFRAPRDAHQAQLNWMLRVCWPFEMPQGGATLALLGTKPGEQPELLGQASKRSVGSKPSGFGEYRAALELVIKASPAAISAMRTECIKLAWQAFDTGWTVEELLLSGRAKRPFGPASERPRLWLGDDADGTPLFLARSTAGFGSVCARP